VGLFRLEMAGGAWICLLATNDGWFGGGGRGVSVRFYTWREHKVREEMVLRWEKDIGFEWTCSVVMEL
jgi:hypothetical protein